VTVVLDKGDVMMATLTKGRDDTEDAEIIFAEG
jgi:hypothetical protein